MNKKLSRGSRLIIFLGLLSCLVLLVASPLIGNASKNPNQQEKAPDVSNAGVRLLIRSQSDSPLVLTAQNNLLPPTKTLYVALIAKNVSKKPIRAYAIRHDVFEGGNSTNGLSLSMKASKKLLFLPGESINHEVGGSDFFPHYLDTIKISVDFVEFDDGTTWGPDTYKSAERIEGYRNGAKEMRKHLTQMLNSPDITPVVKEVESESFELTPPSNKSETWLKGFKTGAASVRARVRNVPKKGEREEIEKAIKSPIDASEGEK